MIKSILKSMAVALIAISAVGAATGAQAQSGADALVRRISVDVIDSAKADKAVQGGDLKRIFALVENKVMPHVDFEVITRSAVGPKWREATLEQRSRLQTEFKSLLIRVYAGALAQVRDQSVEIVRTVPVPGGAQLVVQTEVRGRGEPIRLDYRLDQATGAPDWKIIDVGVGGLWLVQSYRSQFAQALTKGGVDGLIVTLAERNKSAALK